MIAAFLYFREDAMKRRKSDTDYFLHGFGIDKERCEHPQRIIRRLEFYVVLNFGSPDVKYDSDKLGDLRAFLRRPRCWLRVFWL